MRYRLECTSKWKAKDIIKKYPVINKYDPIIDYPYTNPEAERLSVEVNNIIDFCDDIGEEIILGKNYLNNDNMYYLEIYDDYRE